MAFELVEKLWKRRRSNPERTHMMMIPDHLDLLKALIGATLVAMVVIPTTHGTQKPPTFVLLITSCSPLSGYAANDMNFMFA